MIDDHAHARSDHLYIVPFYSLIPYTVDTAHWLNQRSHDVCCHDGPNMHTHLRHGKSGPPHFGSIRVQSTMHTTMCVTSLRIISAIRVQICV
jgi:hypothetical protein